VAALPQIRQYAGRLVKEFRPQRIVLFGSHARGQARKYSDVDLLVVLPFRGRSARKSADIQMRLRPDFPLDLLVRTPAQVRRRLSQGDSFMKEVMEKGRVLHEAPHP
jgi:predicted nucleotidyltransferase